MFVLGVGLGMVMQNLVHASRLGGASRVPDVGSLPAPVAHVIEHAYGTGIAETFLVAAPLGLVAFAALLLLREMPLFIPSGFSRSSREAAKATSPSGAATRNVSAMPVPWACSMTCATGAGSEPTSGRAAARRSGRRAPSSA